MRKLVHFTIICLLLVTVSGCVRELRQVRMNDSELAQRNYPQTEENNNLAFAYAEPMLEINADISRELANGLAERIRYTGGRVACHLNSELDKIILSKGFTITDRYRSIMYMTFSEKRNTTALFYPEIKIHITEKSELALSSAGRFTTNGVLQVDAEVNIIMREPLSGEIIWIKSIPVQAVSDSFEYNNAYWAGAYGEYMKLNTAYYRVGRGQEHHIPENLVDLGKKIDKVFEEIDTKIIEATMRFVEAEEFQFLNTDIKKLKKLNRY